MAEIFPIHTLSLKELINAYLNEAFGLSAIVSSLQSSNLLERHINYDAYLKSNKNTKSSKEFKAYLQINDGILYADDSHPYFKQALSSSHLSACCELFNGHSYTKSQLETTSFSYIIQNWLNTYNNNPAMIERLNSPLHTLDAVRTMQILRALSLVTVRTSSIRQLSLGAGPAEKDITSIHALPRITFKKSNLAEESELLFEMMPVKAESIVISDNDPQRKEQYNKISNDKSTNIIGLNVDTYKALAECNSLNASDNIGTRNFILALRIDHRMLPDIPLFFKLISRCMDQTADLVVTMGSGHTLEDFEGRVNKLYEIFEFLKKLKLNPTLIRLHGKGPLEQQRNTNSFSTRSITTYEILHCKLKKKILHKAVHH